MIIYIITFNSDNLEAHKNIHKLKALTIKGIRYQLFDNIS